MNRALCSRGGVKLRKVLRLFDLLNLTLVVFLIFTIAITFVVAFFDAQLAVSIGFFSSVANIVLSFIISLILSVRGHKSTRKTDLLKYMSEVESKVKTNRLSFFKKKSQVSKMSTIFLVAYFLSYISYILFCVLFGILVTDSSYMMICLAIIGGLLLLFNFRGLFVRYNNHNPGVKIEKDRQKTIYDLINKVCTKNNIPLIELVYVANIPNVAIYYDTKYKQNVLTIGVLYLTSLTLKELELILDHEARHVKNSDTIENAHLTNKITLWRRLIAKSGPILNSFGNTFILLMEFYNTILSRVAEIKADEFSAMNYEDKLTMESALIKTHAITRFDEYLIDHLRFSDYEQPIPNITELTIERFNQHINEDYQKIIEECRLMRSVTFDTHLSIVERIELLGFYASELKYLPFFNHEVYEELKLILPSLNKEWLSLMFSNWRKYSELVAEKKEYIAAHPNPKRDDERFNVAMAYEVLHNYNLALTYYDDILKENPNYYLAKLRKAIILFKKCDDGGIELIKEVAKAKPELAEQCYEKIVNYCYRRGMMYLVDDLNSWFAEKIKDGNKILKRSSYIGQGEKLSSISLNKDDEEALRIIVKNLLEVHSLYVCKKTSDYGEKLFIIIICSIRTPTSIREKYQKRIMNDFHDCEVLVSDKRMPFIKRVLKNTTKIDL